MFKRNNASTEFIASIRYNNIIAEIWNITLNSWDKILVYKVSNKDDSKWMLEAYMVDIAWKSYIISE